MSDWQEASGNTWKPETKGDELIGLLTKVETGVGPNESKMYFVETDKGIVQVWGSTILDMRMNEVKVGEEVRIVFEGLAEKGGRGKNKPKLWKVYHRMPDSENF